MYIIINYIENYIYIFLVYFLLKHQLTAIKSSKIVLINSIFAEPVLPDLVETLHDIPSFLKSSTNGHGANDTHQNGHHILHKSQNESIPEYQHKVYDNGHAVQAMHQNTSHMPHGKTNNIHTPGPGHLEYSVAIGVLVAAKPFFEFIVNPIVGVTVDLYGYRIPILIGFLASFISSLGNPIFYF